MGMEIKTADGLGIEILTELTAPTSVVFINALGIPSDITSILSASLRERGLSFVTWNLRGSPGSHDGNFRQYSTRSHIEDLVALVRVLGLRRIVLVGWCSGIEVALGAVASGVLRPRGLVLLNSPYFFGDGLYRGVRGDSLHKLSAYIVANENKLSFLYSTILENASQEAEHKLRITDPILRALVLAPFLNGAQNLLRYAYLMKNTAGVPAIQQWGRSINLPTRILGGGSDQLVSAEESFALGQLIDGARVDIFPDWDHYALYTHGDEVAAEIAHYAVALTRDPIAADL